MSLLSSGVAFLPESECKSIADFRPVQAFRELFFENVHKSLIYRAIIFLHFLTLKQAIQDGGTGSNPASIIFRTRHRLKPYAGDDAPSGLRPEGACDVGLTPYAMICRAFGTGKFQIYIYIHVV